MRTVGAPKSLSFAYITLTVLGLCLISASEAKTATSDDIIVGTKTYQQPFSQYSSAVATVLKKQPVLGESSLDPANFFTEGDWLMDLGLAHRSGLEQAANINDVVFSDIADAVGAFQAAVPIFQQAEQVPTYGLAAKERLAEVFFSIGETYNLSPNEDEYRLAMEFLMQSEQIYREQLQKEKGGWDEAIRPEIEIRWAHCCHRIGIGLLSMDNVVENEALIDDPEELERIMAKNMDQMLAAVEKAIEYLTRASGVFEQTVQRNNLPMDQSELQRHLATSWQHLGTALTMKGDAVAGAEYSEKALEFYKKVFSRLPAGNTGTEEAMMDIADIMYTLAEQYLQLGSYDKAKQMYTDAMQWYEQYNLAPPVVVENEYAADYDGQTLEVVELQLSGYNDLRDMDASVQIEEGEEYYQRDDGYEGDLHLSIGTLYLDRNDFVSAASHLDQAIQLYELSGETEERNTADAKYNLAILHFRNADFLASDAAYNSALDTYRKVVGDGMDPRMMGLEMDQLEARALARVTEKAKSRVKEDGVVTAKETEMKKDTPEPIFDLEDYKNTLKNTTDFLQDEL
jgi:tetratricopeptide (TPR) repeat protein